ncbi:UvrD-helicase domain-containing protein [Cyanobium sp. FGCU-6]|nr:UvrD-helicase domain-containing protein [Cyanobium sp. FGCU6]
MTTPRDFDANTLPLDPGRRLLEASAGTGKTFALAHLVLRLVSEGGHSLRQLLVVTFTDAAAAELRDRIGRRLQQGLRALEDPAAACDDGVLETWRARVLADPHGPTDQLRGRLLLALEDLDAADITTIHGFAQRSLRRYALEAGMAPDLSLDTDPTTLIAQVVHDYWQQQVLALPPDWLAALQRGRLNPVLLASLLEMLDGDPALGLGPLPPELAGNPSLAEGLTALWQRLWVDFREAWALDGLALEEALRAQAKEWRSHGASSKDTTPYSPSPRTNRVGEIEAFVATAGEQPPGYDAVLALKPLNEYFHPGPFSKVARGIEGEERPIRLPRPALMEAVAALVDGPLEAVLAHACTWGRAELRRRRQRAGTLSYADLLAGLDPGAGATGPTPLLQAVGERYRVALIDEFQDTDPVQWRVLRLAFSGPDHLLVMVGDPKQAIYRFRGGDIATYRQARDSCPEVLELRQNRRSTPELIAALNRLMSEPGLPRSDLEVPEVEACADRHGPDGPSLELLWLGAERPAGAKPPAKGALERELTERTAAHVLSLLRQGAELEDGGRRRPLRPDDICLLVSFHRQAEQLRHALERVGLPSRLVSSADVFATPAATALQRFLDALADPADAGRLRLLAASPLMGWSAEDLASSPPERWSELAGRLDQLARALPRQGLLGVLSELLGSRTLARLARSGRLRADLQQLAELVQRRMHGDQLGVEGAADWLRRLRLDEQRRDRVVPDDHQRHSDREDGCVAVVTVHASKGLEYPVVVCPFLWQSPDRQRIGLGLRWQPPGGMDPVLDLHRNREWGSGWQALMQQRHDQRAEAERLAYVAATRARHRLVLAWGPAAGQQASPLLPWLFPHQVLAADGLPLAEHSDADWLAELERSAAARGLALRIITAGAVAPDPWIAPARALELGLGPLPARLFDRSWGRSSYTGWTQASHGTAPPAALDEGRDISDPSPGDLQPAGEDGADWPEQGPLAEVPRGAEAGDALHRILEAIDYGGDLRDPTTRAVTDQVLRGSGIDGAFSEPVLVGLAQMLTTPCGGELGTFRFADLPRERRLNEMSFDLSLGRARSAALAAAFRHHPGGLFDAAYAERLEALAIDSRGFLTGSIDLVFTAPDAAGQQRWWVADWKSNWLGRRDAEGRPVACGPRHYGTAAMASLMVESHYPLQAHLYLVALHRYLGWRLGDYRPERDLGGYAYVFLRGTPGPDGERALPGAVPGMVVERPPLDRLLALDAALGMGRPEEGAGDG